MNKKKSKKKQPNRFIALSMLASQMGITIYLGAYFGKRLDQNYLNEKPWFTIIGILSALVLSLLSLIKQLNRLNKDD
ncbi:MAG: AtpZ/AtpI family protein [Flavobacteriales bacterium]